MVIPKLHPPRDIGTDSREIIGNLLAKISEDQGANSSIVLSLMITSLIDPGYVFGFLSCYACVRQALIDKEIKDLEEMVNAERP